MIQAGERTGTLEAAIAELAPVLYDEVEASTRSAFALAVPATIITLGVVVGFVVIALYMPIFNMMFLI